jgi:tetratricopeptide (TPR) repeat protein
VRVALAVGLLAIGLHAGFEAMELKIGLFSYYMVMTACVFFLPEKPLWTVRRLVDRALWPLEFLFQQSQRALPDLWPCAPAVVMAVIVAAVLGLCGRAIDMPGAFAAGSIAGGALVAAAIVAAIRNSPQLAARYNIAACVAGLAMWIVVSSSSAPLDHYLLRGNQLLELGRTDNAETHFRQAIQLNPKLVKAHCNLGNICFRRGDYPAALQHYQDALSIDPDDADAQHHLSLARAKIARRSRFQ